MVRRHPRSTLLALLLGGLVLGTHGARAQSGPPEPLIEEGDDAVDEEALPPEAFPPQQPLGQAEMEQQLAPHGRWVDTPEYGQVWIPGGVASDWQPYASGHWVFGPQGWTFISDDPWGAVVYHYGAWDFRQPWGWFWVPGYVWAPAWVVFRYTPGYICWTPYAPHGRLHGRHWPGWVVVPQTHFTAPIRAQRVAQPGAIVRAARPIATPGHAGIHFGGATPGHGTRRGGGHRR